MECNDLIREMIFNHLGGLADLHLNPVDVEDPDVRRRYPQILFSVLAINILADGTLE